MGSKPQAKACATSRSRLVVTLRASTACVHVSVQYRVWGLNGIPRKAERNFQKHGVRFSTEAITVFSDDYAITVSEDESDASERRFVSLGMGGLGRLIVVVYTWRGEDVRIISARPADPHERKEYEAQL